MPSLSSHGVAAYVATKRHSPVEYSNRHRWFGLESLGRTPVKSEDRDRHVSYTGSPEPIQDQVWRLLSPRGGAVTDGLRLAAINTVCIIAALILLAVASLVNRLINVMIPLPFLVTAVLLVIVLTAVGVVIWYRYAGLYVRVARGSGRAVKPDVLGGVAGLPFAAIALFMLAAALLQILLGIISFSSDRLIDALRQAGFSGFFFALCAANIAVARAASTKEA